MIKLIIIEGTWGVLAITMVSIISAPATTANITMAKIIMAKIIIAQIIMAMTIMAKIIMANIIMAEANLLYPCLPTRPVIRRPGNPVYRLWGLANWQLAIGRVF